MYMLAVCHSIELEVFTDGRSEAAIDWRTWGEDQSTAATEAMTTRRWSLTLRC